MPLQDRHIEKEAKMYKRQIINQLNAWKAKDTRKPLILRGARQVGKTTCIKEFGKTFDHFIYLNLETEDDAALFRNYQSVGDIIDFLFLRHRIRKAAPGDTLLFIDEIQEEERAVALLRYFYEQAPWLYVIAAGSRLQTLVRKHISFPVGRVEYITLRPFSFREYLCAIDGEEWEAALDSMETDGMTHQQLIKRFNQYALIGGMPEAVSSFISTNDIESVSTVYRSLQTGYAEDVERYAKSETQRNVMRHILMHGWASAGQAITFAKFAGSDYSSTQVHEAMDILQKAFILYLDYPITATQAPAVPSLTRSPKLVWVDSGLVNFFAGIQIEYLQNKDLLDTWRGHAAEQIVAQELRVVLDRHWRDEQYYWVRDKKGATAEVDFVWQNGSRIIPIEVKSGTNSHLRSLHSFVNSSPANDITAVRVWSGAFSVQRTETPAPARKPFTLVNLPFYMVGQTDKVVASL